MSTVTGTHSSESSAAALSTSSDSEMAVSSLNAIIAASSKKPKHWRVVLMTVLGIMLTLFVMESAARILVVAGKPSRSKSPEFDTKLILASQPFESGRPLVFVGGSYQQQAIFPELLRVRMATSGINVAPKNLATRRSSLMEQQVMLETALKHAKQPAVVFWDLRQEAFMDQFVHRRRDELTEDFLATYTGRKFSESLEPRQKILLFFEKHSALVRDRAFIRHQLSHALQSIFTFETAYQNRFAPLPEPVTELSQLGTMPCSIVYTPEEFAATSAKFDHTFVWRPEFENEWTLEKLEQMQKTCRKYNATLVVLWLPELPPKGRELREAKLVEHFSKMDNNKDTFFVDLHNIDKDPTHFKDKRHCNLLGAIRATECLATQLSGERFKHLFKDDHAKSELIAEREQTGLDENAQHGREQERNRLLEAERMPLSQQSQFGASEGDVH